MGATIRTRTSPRAKLSRKRGLSTEQFPVSTNVWSSKNLKDLERVQAMVLHCLHGEEYRGTSPIRTPPLPRATIGP